MVYLSVYSGSLRFDRLFAVSWCLRRFRSLPLCPSLYLVFLFSGTRITFTLSCYHFLAAVGEYCRNVVGTALRLVLSPLSICRVRGTKYVCLLSSFLSTPPSHSFIHSCLSLRTVLPWIAPRYICVSWCDIVLIAFLRRRRHRVGLPAPVSRSNFTLFPLA